LPIKNRHSSAPRSNYARLDAMLATEIHGAHAAVGEGTQQFLALGGRITQAAVAASADDGGVEWGPIKPGGMTTHNAGHVPCNVMGAAF
jgi:hypothetical protein